ncbi:hypothetical protein POTOM_056237 [Populus tomentosa]|uniref:Uncharacterized protein n=1 Tax=Populus tomentosa TaxID=118781 RepID=A0A8X7XUC6_POPTO|nr:hypothetical protein POTOM_056237 [Populus tomentosa]
MQEIGREKMSKVPRRESPWGMPEGDNREPKAHRCNDRAEDVIQIMIDLYQLLYVETIRLVLRVTRLRQFLDLSSSFGNACALNLGMFWFRFGVSLSVLSTSFHDFSRLPLEPLIGRNQQRRTPTCKLIPQGERCNLSKNSFFHCIRETSFCSNLMFARLPTFGYVIKGVNCNKYSHLEWRHRYSSLSFCNNDKR